MIQLTQAHVLGVIIAFLLGIFIVPIVIYFSKKAGLVDKPDVRKIHSGEISRLGGVAIWLSVMLTFVLLIVLSYYPKGVGLSGIIVGGSLMFLLGLVDDIFTLGAKFKFLIQVSIATMVILLGVRIDEVVLPVLGIVELGVFAYPLTLLWIVGISNALNFIDGIDGLAGSVATISCCAIGVVSLAISPSSPITALVAFILMGAIFAFLMFNYNPAKIFMGDSGSLYVGFMLATLSITGIAKNSAEFAYLPLLILLVPILDVAISSTRRIMKGVSPFTADSEHIHHNLLNAGFSQDKVVLSLASIGMACALLSIAIVVLTTSDTPLATAVGAKGKYFLWALGLIVVLLLLSVASKLIKKTNK